MNNAFSTFLFCFSIGADENEVESECEDDGETSIAEVIQSESHSTPQSMSWLLQTALENLGVTVCNYIVSSSSSEYFQKNFLTISVSFTTETKPSIAVGAGASSKFANHSDDGVPFRLDQIAFIAGGRSLGAYDP